MKKSIFFVLGLIGLTSLILNFVSCHDEDVYTKPEPVLEKQVLKQITPLGNGVNLPIGTKWHHTDKSQNEVRFELPSGYKFLVYDATSARFSLAFDGTGYSCTCSSGSCITFYNKDLGYGCLQGDCTGTCTGKASRLGSEVTIEGIVYVENDMLDVTTKEHASLSKLGKEGIFTIPSFRDEIKRTYDAVYWHMEKPNFSDDDFEKTLNKDQYIIAKTYLYGFEIGILIPNDPNLSDFIPNLVKVSLRDDAPTRCNCSGTGTGCALQKKGLLGYVVYYCSGCSTCTMN